MCCNVLKVVTSIPHAVVIMWSCVELLIKCLFLWICFNSLLLIYGDDTINAYAHSSAPNDTYLAIDDAHTD